MESVKYFTKRDSKIHCAFLDASKAFNKVLINGLLNKLIDRKSLFTLYHYCITGIVTLAVLLCGIRR